MSKTTYEEGNRFRETSDDGRTSYAGTLKGFWGTKVYDEVADHHPDGTTIAYEYDPSFRASLFDGGRGKKK